MVRNPNSPPRKDDWRDGLVYLQNEVYGQQLLSVLGASRQGVHGRSGRQGEHADTDQDGRFTCGDSDEPGSDDVGDDTDSTWNHVVQDCLERRKTETPEDESWDKHRLRGVEQRKHSRPKVEIPPETSDTQKTMIIQP